MPASRKVPVGTSLSPSGSAGQTQYQSGGFHGQLQGAFKERWHEQPTRDLESVLAENGDATDLSQPTSMHGGSPSTEASLASGERVVFSEEGSAACYIELIAKGEVDLDMIEAFEDFVADKSGGSREADGRVSEIVRSAPRRKTSFDIARLGARLGARVDRGCGPSVLRARVRLG